MLKIKYKAHVADEGWQDEVYNGQIAGTVGKHKAIEAVRITGIDGLDENVNLGITGIAHVQDIGWGEDSPTGTDIGSTGLGKHLEAIKLNVFGNDANDYEVWYRVHVENKGFMNWCRNGEPAGTEGGNLQIEAIQIFLRRKDENFWMGTDTMIPFEKIEKEIAPPEPAPEPADSKRKRVIDNAASRIGQGGTEYQNRFGIQGLDWCAAFVGCVLIDCGLKGITVTTTWVQDFVDWAKPLGRWHGKGSGYHPKSGDLIIFDFNGNNYADHVGIVHSSNGFYDTHSVEGNTGSPRQVRMQHRVSGIMGYVELPY